MQNSNSAANEAFGVFADETGAGNGAVTLSGVTYFGAPNGSGNTGRNRDRPLMVSIARVELGDGPRVTAALRWPDENLGCSAREGESDPRSARPISECEPRSLRKEFNSRRSNLDCRLPPS